MEHGFYYDFAVPRPFTPEDLERIEGRMREIVAKGVMRRENFDAEEHEGQGDKQLQTVRRPKGCTTGPRVRPRHARLEQKIDRLIRSAETAWGALD